MAPLLSVDEARRLILERATPLPSERVPLAEAAGRVLAEAARATVDLPPFPSSAMDGFALRAADAPGRLPVVARIAAGHPAPRPLAPGEAMGIATGGVVPEGADAVVPIEVVTDEGDTVEVPAVEPGAHVRPRGGDLRRDDVVVEAGTILRPAELAATRRGRDRRGRVRTASAHRRRHDRERAPPSRRGSRAGPDLRVERRHARRRARVGRRAVEPPVSVADDEAEHRAALERGLDADVLVTSGGVSVGPHDLVRRIEQELGVEEVFWRVAVKPGKPISFGVRGSTLVFGLPGNPVSSLVGFELFVRPALLALQGARDPGPPFQPGVLGSSVRRNAERDEFLRARLRDGVLEPLTGQESHMIARAAAADALVLAPRGDGELEAGSRVRYLLLR